MPRRVVVRAVLTSASVVLLAAPALVLAGAFLPGVSQISRLGAFVDVGLPWLAAAVGAAVVLTAFAVALGGRRFTVGLLAVTLALAAASGVVWVRYEAFANQDYATFDIGRGLRPEPPYRPADASFAYPADDPAAQLHAELWRAPAGAPSAGPNGRAAIVYVHGGAFVGGGLHSRPTLFAAFAAAGYPVLDVEYRLAPPPRWSDAPADVLCGLVFLRSIAAVEGIDPARVVVMGDSAGGSLGLLAAYAAGTTQLAASCSGKPIAPAGVVAIAPAADLAGIWADGTIEAAGLRFPEAYTGGSPTEVPDRYSMASPFRLIRPGLPPTLLITGENDHLVLRPRVSGIADALEAAGDDVRVLIIPFADHGFDGQPNGFGAQLEESIVPSFVAGVTRRP